MSNFPNENAYLLTKHVLGMCTAGICFGPGPSPGVDSPAKRQLTKQRIFGELCPGNFVPCFIGQGGYEVSVCKSVQHPNS